VFWQPNLIKPQVIKFPTSHVDILPTLLDLLGLQYDRSRFQGYSVLRGAPNRKYIFTMDGFGDCMSAITPDMKKVTLSFVNEGSTAFDLAADPAETHPLSRYRFPDEVNAILKFRNYQWKMLSEYNAAQLRNQRYPGQLTLMAGNNGFHQSN
jgi:arylsulfatase A-like enzyme